MNIPDFLSAFDKYPKGAKAAFVQTGDCKLLFLAEWDGIQWNTLQQVDSLPRDRDDIVFRIRQSTDMAISNVEMPMSLKNFDIPMTLNKIDA